jgi:hypothetical protein
MKAEDLGSTLYLRAAYKDPWLNLIKRDRWPVGAGLIRSAFTIGRSEPTTDEETWAAIATVSGETFVGSCGVTYNQTHVGHKEITYKPEGFGLVGPLMCVDDFTLHWNSEDFWMKYFQALEKRNTKSITNRLENIYMNYVPKASASTSFSYIDGNPSTQPPGSTVDMTGVTVPDCGLDQTHLDETANILMEEGADEPNTNGWCTQGANGPIFPLLIGVEMSAKLLKANVDIRSDYNISFQGWGDANPVIKRRGASRVVGNFRHVITRFPARWARVANGATIALTPDTNYTNSSGSAQWKRIPRFYMTTNSTFATKGQVAETNDSWRDPAIAGYEAALVLNPWVYTEEVLVPVNSVSNARFPTQNYFGEWKFVTGNDAVLGFDDCAGVKDPTHKNGRHFAEYRHAAKPIFPQYGRMILFKRCVDDFECPCPAT